EPFEEAPAGVSEDEVVVRGRAEIGGVAEIAHAPVLQSVVPADLGGAVRRSVVADHQLEVAACLREHRADGLLQIPLAVVDGDTDRHRRGRTGSVWELIHIVLARSLTSKGQNLAAI